MEINANTVISFCSLVLTAVTVWKIGRVQHQTNSMKDELVAEVRKSAKAEGVKQEKERTEPETDNIVITR